MNQDQTNRIVKNTAADVSGETRNYVSSKEQQINALGKNMSGQFDRIFGIVNELDKDTGKQTLKY